MALSRRLTMICFSRAPITPHHSTFQRRQVDVDIAILRHQTHLFGSTQRQPCQVDIDPIAPRFAGIQPRQHQQSGYQVFQARDFFENAAHAFAQITLGYLGFMCELLQLTLNYRERCAKLMRGISEKPARCP